MSVVNVSAQNFHVAELKNCRWVATDIYFNDDGGEYALIFTDSLFIHEVRFTADGETVRKIAPYHLSDVGGEAFDSTKVGSDSSGKYIVEKSRVRPLGEKEWRYEIDTAEILGYSETQLTVKFPSGNIYTFRREPLH